MFTVVLNRFAGFAATTSIFAFRFFIPRIWSISYGQFAIITFASMIAMLMIATAFCFIDYYIHHKLDQTKYPLTTQGIDFHFFDKPEYKSRISWLPTTMFTKGDSKMCGKKLKDLFASEKYTYLREEIDKACMKTDEIRSQVIIS